MSQTVIICIYKNGIIANEDGNIAFYCDIPNQPVLTRIRRGTSFEDLKGLVHQKLKLQPNEMVSQLLYRMPFSVNPLRYSSIEVMDDDGVEAMLDCHDQCSGILSLSCIEINATISYSPPQDYIPEIPVDFNLHAAGPSNTFQMEENEEAAGLTEDFVNMPPASPYDMIEDEALYDALVGNDIEDIPDGSDFEDEEPRNDDNVDNTRDIPAANVITYFVPTRAQSEIDVGAAGERADEEPGDWEVSTWTAESELKKGLLFADKASLKEAIKIYSIRRHYDYKVSRSAENYFEAKCVKQTEGCKWRVRACLKASLQLWLITKYDGDHTCVSTSISHDHKKLDSELIASCIVGMVGQAPDIAVSQIIQRVKEEHMFTVSYKKAWAGKQKAIATVYGNWEASYDTLRRWMAAVQRFLPGTIVAFQTRPFEDDTSSVQFRRLFWAFKPCIDAWTHLKPVVQVDGTFLYGKYRHTLLIATGQDGNRNIVPLAFAIVEGETESAWAWFLWRLRGDVVKDTNGVCLISDRGAGCLAAVEDEQVGWQPPRAYHVFCIRHLASNFNTKFRNKALRRLFVNAGDVAFCKLCEHTVSFD